MRLYIIRHGEPDYSRDCLTERGWKQAEAVGRRLMACGIDRVYASPMGRARETAQPLCRMLGIEPVIEDWAHEIGDERMTTYPDGVLKSVSALQNTYFRRDGNWARSYEQAFDCPGMRETQMRQKVDFLERSGNKFLARLGYRAENGIYRIERANEEGVALFCHAAMGRAWIASLLRIPIHIMWASFDYNFTGVTMLEFKNNADGVTAPTCWYYGDTSHVVAEGDAQRGSRSRGRWLSEAKSDEVTVTYF